jgi:hypothetical protein
LIKDKSGNLYVMFKSTGFGFAKYNSHLVEQWQFLDDKQSLTINYLSIATDGSVFYSGNRGVVNVGPSAVAGKVNPAGTLAWENVVGAGANNSTSCAVTPDGGVIFAGSSSGQVIGNPPDVTGGPWLARYGSDGTRSSLKQYNEQYTGAVGGSSSLSVDPSGNIYLLAGDAMKVSASGDIISFVAHDGSQLGGRTFHPASTTSAGDAFYVSANVLSQYDTSLKRLVDMQFESARMKVIDPVEGVTWTGNFGSAISDSYIDTTSSGAIYLAGGYSNTYKNGSVPRPTTQPLYVGRYKADGSRVWFKEFGTDTSGSGRVAGIVSDDTTNSVVVFGRGNSSPGNTGSFLFKLNAADGTVIQSP